MIRTAVTLAASRGHAPARCARKPPLSRAFPRGGCCRGVSSLPATAGEGPGGGVFTPGCPGRRRRSGRRPRRARGRPRRRGRRRGRGPARAGRDLLRRRVKRRSPRPDCRVPRSWPSPRSSRSRSASSKPSRRLDERLEARLRGVGQLELRPRDQQAVGLLGAAADPASELVELREPEAVGLLDDHDRRVRDVDADLDHGRRDEHVELAVLERPHHLAPVGRLQPAVDQADAVAGELGAPQPLRLLLGRRASLVSDASISGQTT